MDWLAAPDSWWGRLIVERGIAAVYVVAFACAALQFRGLLGTRGMTPVPEFLRRRSSRSSPSIFHLHYSDRFFAVVCWAGRRDRGRRMVGGLADAGSAVGGDGCCGSRSGWRTCRSSTSARSGTRSAGSPCCWRPASSPSSSATTTSRRPRPCCGCGVAAVPGRVRRGPDQDAGRQVLAEPDVPGLPPRDPADAGPAQLVLPPSAEAVAPRRGCRQPRHPTGGAVRPVRSRSRSRPSRRRSSWSPSCGWWHRATSPGSTG